MLTFTGAVARSVHRPLLVADLAFGTYEAGPMDAVHHAVELVRAGAEMVKLEGAPRSRRKSGPLSGRGSRWLATPGSTRRRAKPWPGHRGRVGRPGAAGRRGPEP